MLDVATWIRPKDAPFFARAFEPHPEVRLHNAFDTPVAFGDMAGLLLSGGADIAPEFLKQEIPDASVLDPDFDRKRDAWEFEAVRHFMERGRPVFGICKGMQLLNVALGGTLRLDIPGHNAPEMRDHDVQPLRTAASARHKFEKVNSSHHQAIDRVADGFEVEAWSAGDDIVEQMKMRSAPFVFAVQYHPERGDIYGSLFADFVAHLKN